MAASEFVSILAPGTKQELESVLPLLKQIEGSITNINSRGKGGLGFEKASLAKQGIRDVSNELVNQNKLRNENERLIQRINDKLKAEALENAKLRVQLSELTKEQKKQAQEALGVLTSYQKLSAELNELRSSAKATAADMFLLEQAGKQNTPVYQKLSQEYERTSKRVLLLDNGLKKIDANLGQHQRNVGNYASGWNGLGNAINQIAREAPAFAVSMNTGFLAISNNLPILIDEIERLKLANKELIAQGKPVQSVMAQIAKSFFSFQTLLSVGITLLTLYGGKLIDWATNNKTVSKEVDKNAEALKKLIETQTSYNEKAAKFASDEVNRVNMLYEAATKKELSDEKRIKNVDELQRRYPDYLANIKKEDILSGKAAEAIHKLNQALINRGKALAIQELLGENLAKQIRVELEYERALGKTKDTQELYDIQQQSSSKSKKDYRLITEEENNSLKALQKTQDESREKLGKYTIQTLNANNVRVNSLIPLKEEEELLKRILEPYLKYIDIVDKESKSNIETAKSVDYLASQYEYLRQQLENEAAANERLINDEEVGFERREKAAKRYFEIQSELALRARDEQVRQIELTSKAEIAELEKRIKDKEVTEKSGNAAIYAIRKQADYDSLTAHAEYAGRVDAINYEISQSLKGVWNAINFQKAKNLISERELELTRQYVSELEQMTQGVDYRKFEDAQRKFAEGTRELSKVTIQAEIDEMEVELRRLNSTEANVQRRLELQGLLIDKQKQLADVTKEELQEQAQAWEQLQRATESYLEGFTSSFMSDAGLGSLGNFLDQQVYEVVNEQTGKIERKVGSTFQKMLDGADSLKEKFAVTFTAITEVAQEAFNFMTQNTQAYYDNQREMAKQDYEIAKAFVGNETEAREEIEKQYQERQREIKRREWEANKKAALFNIALNTAQGVTAALASVPPNVPLSFTIGAIGLAQAALVQAQEVPAYKYGTPAGGHKGGPMLINDAPGGSFKEVVRTPDGKVFLPQERNMLIDAPMGTEVFKNYDDFARKSGFDLRTMNNDALNYAGLNRQLPTINIDNGFNDAKVAQSVAKGVRRALKGSQRVNFSFNEDGAKTWVGSQSGKIYSKGNNNKRGGFNI